MKFGAKQFPVYRNLDSLMLEIHNYPSLNKEKDQKSLETCSTSDTHSPCPLVSRPIEPKRSYMEVSFGFDFLKEHIQTYTFYLENYMEKMPQLNWQKQKCFFKAKHQKHHLTQQSSQKSIFKYLRALQSPKNSERIREYILKIQEKQLVKSFLEAVCTQTAQELAVELVQVSLYIWECHLLIQSLCQTSEQLIEYLRNSMEKIAQKIREGKSFNYLKFEVQTAPKNIEREPNITAQGEFFEVFVKTFFLVLSGYLNNPCHEKVLQAKQKDHYFFNIVNVNHEKDYFSDIQNSSEDLFIGGKKPFN